MKKQLVFLSVSALLFVTPVLAKDNNQGRSDEHRPSGLLSIATIAPEPSQTPAPSASPTLTPSSTPSTAPCDPDGDWKNHGQFVSCVAKEHEGGDEVSEAARSDVGKKHHHPSSTPSPMPSVSPSASASAEPSATPPITFSVMSFKSGFNFDLGNQLEKLFESFSHLFHH
jgi:hypothetical protein